MCESESFTKIPGMCAQQQGTFLKSGWILFVICWLTCLLIILVVQDSTTQLDDRSAGILPGWNCY